MGTNWEGFDENTEIVDTIFSDNPEEIKETPVVETKLEEEIVEQPESKKEVTVDDIYEPTDDKETVVTEQANVLRATAEYFAEKYELELPEASEWNEETYAEFQEQLVDYLVSEKYTAAKQSNEVADAILSVIEQGGDASDILSLFHQQREFNEIDTSTIEGKVEKIKKYYKDVEGKPTAWIEKYIKKLSVGDDDSDILEEFNSVNEQFDQYVNAEKEAKIQEVQQIKQQKEARRNKQITDFTKTLDEQKIPKTQAKDLQEFIFQEKYRVKGTDEVITGLEVELRKIMNNPAKLLDLAQFLKDEESFKNKISTKINSEKTENKFSAIMKKQQVNNNNTTETVKSHKPVFQLP